MGARAFARPRFPGQTPYCQGSGQAGFCPCTLRRSSDPPEPTFGRPCYLFAGVPPQPNRPPDAVPRADPGLGPQATIGGVSLAAPPPPEERAHRLPPTLRIVARGPTPGCGKAPRGLLSLRGAAGLCTGHVGFTGSRAGTVGPSLIHSCAPELSGAGGRGLSEHDYSRVLGADDYEEFPSVFRRYFEDVHTMPLVINVWPVRIYSDAS